ncbi:F-actin-capping protein subunit alpha [Monosporozyma unispora]|nr:F-actin-capping protein subunit alpha [Kazachstania unispora]
MSEFNTIIKNIINDASPGELNIIVQDLLTITGVNGKDTILTTVREYNMERGTLVHLDDGESFVISKHNHVENDLEEDNDKFIDYNNGNQIIKVDQLTLQASRLGETISNGIGAIPIDTGLKEYVSKNFPGDHSIAIYPLNGTEGKFVVYIISDKYNESNFWNGEWRSQYIWDSNNNIVEEGEINVDVHYYEDGNVRFQSQKKYFNDNSDTGSLVDAIKSWETQFTNDLYDQFENLNERQFKGLRRKLPVTRSKVNWGKAIGNYRLGKDAANR